MSLARNVRDVLVTSNDVDMDAAFTAMAAFPTLNRPRASSSQSAA
jgi:hypothetical protein